MAKVTWSVPLVQYGRCEIEFEGNPDFVMDSERFGREYADFVAGVMRGYEARVEEIRTGAVKTVKDTLGATEVGEESTPEPVQDEDAPSWERKVEKSEPWKSGGPVKKPAKIEWN